MPIVTEEMKKQLKREEKMRAERDKNQRILVEQEEEKKKQDAEKEEEERRKAEEQEKLHQERMVTLRKGVAMFRKFDSPVKIVDEEVVYMSGYSITRKDVAISTKGKIYHANKGDTQMIVKVILLKCIPLQLQQLYRGQSLKLVKFLGQCPLNFKLSTAPAKTDSKRSLGKNEVATEPLRHQSLIRVFEVFEANSKAYIFMEELSTFNLGEYIKNKDIGEMWPMAMQIADSINYLHSNGIAHLNIKIDNFLFDKSMNIKLSGLSRAYVFWDSDIEEVIKHCKFDRHNREYYPPEAFVDAFKPVPVDIFSFGVVLCRMFFADSPYSPNCKFSKDINDVGQKWNKFYEINVSKGKIKNVPQECMDLLNKIFVQDPENRILFTEMLKLIPTPKAIITEEAN